MSDDYDDYLIDLGIIPGTAKRSESPAIFFIQIGLTDSFANRKSGDIFFCKLGITVFPF